MNYVGTHGTLTALSRCLQKTVGIEERITIDAHSTHKEEINNIKKNYGEIMSVTVLPPKVEDHVLAWRAINFAKEEFTKK